VEDGVAPSINNTHGSHLLIVLVILVLCHVRIYIQQLIYTATYIYGNLFFY
jgi:hypothetical protein